LSLTKADWVGYLSTPAQLGFLAQNTGVETAVAISAAVKILVLFMTTNA